MRITLFVKRSFLTIVLLLWGSVAAEVGEQGRLQIADEPTTPRQSAMGGVGAALTGGGFGFYNPASPAFTDLPFISFEYGSSPGDDNTGDLAKSKIESSWTFKKWFVGASLADWSTDYLNANEQSVGGPGSWQLLQATVTGGFKIGRLAIGNSFNFFNDRIGDEVQDQVFTYSPGFFYQLVPGKVALGGSLMNYVRLDTTLAKLAWFGGAISLPRYVRMGAAWTDTLKRAAMPFTAAADIVYSEVYHRLMMPVGLEVWVLPCLAARLGIPVHHPSDLAHFGVGLRISSVDFDFDYGVTQPVSGGSYEQKWLLGLSYALPGLKAEEKKKPEKTAAAPRAVKPKPEPASAPDSSAISVPVLPQ